MIVKKPYAFLIRHFKLIHLILFGLLIYIAIKSTSLLTFFNDYVKTGFYTYVENLSGTYINLFMFFDVILIIIFGVIIYLLMKWKDKNRTFYISLCIFYLVTFALFFVYYNALVTIETNVLDVRVVRIYRDIILMLTIPQYFFLIVCLVRGVGFNIKQFDFKKDLEDLKIELPDEEEVEVTFGKESYKYKRKARRMLREIKYYALENKFFFIVITSVVTLSLFFVIYLNFAVYNKVYDERDNFNVDGVVFSVINSYLTDIDYKGNIINNEKIYVVLLLNMTNTSNVKKELETDDLRLYLKNDMYLPIFSKNNYFKDLAEGYYNQVLYPGETYEYLLVFELPKEKISHSYNFRMIDSVNILKGEINARYKDIKVEPKRIEKLELVKNFNVKEVVYFEESLLGDSEVIVNGYNIGNSFTENYNYCINECYVGTKIITPDIVGKTPKTLIKLVIDMKINNKLSVSKYLINKTDFINMYASLNYFVSGVEKNVLVNGIVSNYIVGDNVYLEVPGDVSLAEEINLYLTIRNIRYIIKLK